MKREMTFEEIIKKDHYKSIITLTNYYMKKKKSNFHGLRAAHYRFALCPNHDNIQNRVFKLSEYFGNDLQKLYDSKKIIKNCISDRKNLSNFLTKLVDRGILIKEIKDRVAYYYTSPLIRGYIDKLSVTKSLKEYHPATVQMLYGMKIKEPFEIMVNGAWFGSPLNIDFTPDEKENMVIAENIDIMYNAAARLFHLFKKQKKDVDDMMFVLDVGTPKERKKE